MSPPWYLLLEINISLDKYSEKCDQTQRFDNWGLTQINKKFFRYSPMSQAIEWLIIWYFAEISMIQMCVHERRSAHNFSSKFIVMGNKILTNRICTSWLKIVDIHTYYIHLAFFREIYSRAQLNRTDNAACDKCYVITAIIDAHAIVKRQ